MKRALLVGVMAAALVFIGATPVAAQSVVKESSCSETYGTNSMTYDCGFNVSNYLVGTPIKVTVNYACTGACGPVTSFGLRKAGFTPGGVSGRLVAAKKMTGAVELTFMFDALKQSGNGAVGNAHFVLNVSMDDGSGTRTTMPCNLDVHLRQ